MSWRACSLLGLGLLLALSTGVHAQTIGWQEAVARLAAERTRAETCAGLLKKHGDEAAKSQGAITYGEAKAEVDGTIAGLVVALAQGTKPANLPDLEAKLRRAVAGREAFCTTVEPLVHVQTGEKNPVVIAAVISATAAVVGPLLVEAVKALAVKAPEADRLTAKTIQTQLEAATWPTFALVPPSP